jgi:beta-glucanase (GH16 family)
MRFSLDGAPYWQVTAKQWYSGSPQARSNPMAPFDQPFYLMANLAVGGRLAEDNNDKGIVNGVVPAEFMIDWIRIYQCKDDRETGLACITGAKGGN